MVSFTDGFVHRGYPVRRPPQMHVVEKDKAVAGGSEVPFKHGNDFFVGCFMLGISDGVFAIVDLFTVLVKTECEWSDVKR